MISHHHIKSIYLHSYIYSYIYSYNLYIQPVRQNIVLKKDLYYNAGGDQVRFSGKGVRTDASGCLIDLSEGKVQLTLISLSLKTDLRQDKSFNLRLYSVLKHIFMKMVMKV